ncbi:MAG: cache domain-containing protein [Bacillota bacterium]
MIIRKLRIWQSYFMGFIILIIVIISITSYISVKLFNTGIEQQAEVAINKDLDATHRILSRRLEMLFLYLDTLSCNPMLRDIHREPGIQNLLIEIKNRRELSFAYIVDPEGIIIASANNRNLTGERVPEGSFIYRFLDEQSRKGIVVLDESFLIAEGLDKKATFKVTPTPKARVDQKTEEKRGLALVASVPFFDDTGNAQAFLIAGDLLNRDQKFVDEISGLLKVYATIFLNDLRISTSVRLKGGERALGTRVSAEVAAVVLEEGRRYLGSTSIIDQNYLAAYDPIIDDRGEVVGMLFVGIPEAPFVSMKKNTISQYIYISIFSILLALVIAYSLSRTITRPLHLLTHTMEKVELGDLSQRVTPQIFPSKRSIRFPKLVALFQKIGIKLTPHEGDEIQQLGNIFNRMMISLQANWERNQKLQQSLEEKEKNRVQLLRKIINIQEEERKRIARELHDETSQSLTSLMLMLKTVQQSDDISVIRKLTETLREVIYNTLEEIQKLSYELRPMALDKLGVDEALKRYIRELAQHMDININYNNQDCKFSRLGPAIETTVYRIVQEALTNAVRHAKPQNIEITLLSDDKTVTVVVQDDGIGFDLQEVQTKGKEALGLLGMMERASLVGGELKIKTAPGKGTRILLKLPLHEIENLQQNNPMPPQEHRLAQ